MMTYVARFYATFFQRQGHLSLRLFQRSNTGSCNISGGRRSAFFGQPIITRMRRPSTICKRIFNKKILDLERKDLLWIVLQNCKTWKNNLHVNLKTWRNLMPNKIHGFLMLVVVTGSFVARSSLNIIHCQQLKLSHKSRISAHETNQGKGFQETKKKKKNGTELSFDWKLFFKFLWPDMWLFALASLSAFAVAMVNIQIPLLLGELINIISSLNREANQLTDVINVLYKPSIKLLINYTLQSALTFIYISLLSAFGERFAARLRIELFNSLVCQDVAFFDVHKTGELVNRLTTDVQDFKSSFKQCISQGLRSSTQSIGCIITMYAVSPKLTTVMLIVVPGIVFVGALIGSLLRRLSMSAQGQVARATSVADEALGNIRVVRSFAMEGQETSLYSKEIYKSQYLNELLGMGIGMFQGLSNLAINSMVLVVLYSGGILIDSQEIKAGELMSFLLSMQAIQRSLGVLSILYGQVLRGLSAGVRVFEYINVEPTIPVQGGQMIPIGDVKGQIEFKNVCFRYPCRPEYSVLEDVNLTAESGKMVALCGPSGSGKSTIAALIERFYDAQSGSIEIDGVNVKELDPAWLRGQLVGFISQEPVLFATSVKENIRYGRPNATDLEVYDAAITANADSFIREFPNGYNTILGERGVTVSGGQKQRIAIARALLKDPQILILDEATSALDAESERIVQEALDRATKGRTVLVIAHRLSTIKNADLIAVLSDGHIRELGTHEELLRKRGLYAELINRQTDEKQS